MSRAEGFIPTYRPATLPPTPRPCDVCGKRPAERPSSSCRPCLEQR